LARFAQRAGAAGISFFLPDVIPVTELSGI